MADWLTEAWGAEVVAALESWPEAGEGPVPAPVDLSVTVLGGPGGDVTGTLRLWPDGDGPGREVGLTLPAPETRAVIAGELAPSVAFMRGRMKTAGDPGAVLEVLEATTTPGWEAARTRVAALTDDSSA